MISFYIAEFKESKMLDNIAIFVTEEEKLSSNILQIRNPTNFYETSEKTLNRLFLRTRTVISG